MKDNIKNTYLAADFGGGSGRIIAGSLLHGKLELEEVHRFSNRQVKLGNHVYWDFPALFEDMKTGLKLAAQKGYTVKGIGIDTWGVDFGLIDKNGNLLSNPICYRDARTDGMPAKVFKVLDEQQHYTTTGIQVMAINTLFQLYSMKQNRDPQLEIAHQLLFMPDLFSYFLTGIANNEYCIASTSELLDAKRRNWSQETIRALELPEHLFGEIIQPGTIRGTLKEDIARETGLGAVDVIAVGSHDTASAVAAVPATKTPIAFLSSGTWSLLGVEVNEPILTEEARKAEFTNEGGVGGRIRFLQNITGLWILQRLMSEWKARGEEQHYDTIIPQAAEVETDTIIPVDAPEFMNPENMETALMNYCRDHSLHIPQSKAETVKCVLQSLAFKYQQAVEKLNHCLPSPIRQLNIIGGGSQNKLLNQLTADALNIPVYAGPVEATAIGNILTQAMAKGEISDLRELREIVSRSVHLKYIILKNKKYMETPKTGYQVQSYSVPVKRYCQTLDLRDSPELIAEYRKRHSQAEAWPEILAGIREVGILEMEIYILGTRLFMIVETPVDFDWDTAMARLNTLPRQQEWEEYMAIFQQAAPGMSSAEKWKPMERMFHLYNT